MGFGQQKYEDEIICYANSATDAVRMHLKKLMARYSKEAAEEGIKNIADACRDCENSTWLIHNVLFLHLDAPEVEVEKSRLEYFALINLDWNPIPLEFYMDTIFQCRLHEHFLAMVNGCRHLALVWECLSAAEERIIASKEKFGKNEWLLYLSVLPRLSSKALELFGKTLSSFVQLSNDDMPSLCKIEVLIRVVGMLLKETEDNGQNSEVGDLIRELRFDPMKQSRSWSSTLKFYTELQPVDFAEVDDHLARSNYVDVIDSIMVTMEFDPLDEDTRLLMAASKDPVKISKEKASEITYIGDCAYLSELILKRYLQNHEVKSGAENILAIVGHLKRFKTPTEYEDYTHGITSFQTFCKFLRCCAKNPREYYLLSWCERFCSYDEAFTTEEGCAVAEEIVVPYATRALGLKIINRVMKMPLNESLKRIVLNVVFSDRHWGCDEGLDEAVFQLVFQHNQSNSRLELEDFLSQINNLVASLGSGGSFDKKTYKIESQYVKSIWKLAIQNPVVTAQELFVRAVELPHIGGHIMKCLKQFFTLKCPEEANTKFSERDVNLFEFCIEEILSRIVNGQMKNLSKILIRRLVEAGAAPIERLEELIISFIEVVLTEVGPDKLQPIMEIQEAFAQYILEDRDYKKYEESLRKLCIHLEGIKQYTYMAAPEYHVIRDMTAKILAYIRTKSDLAIATPRNSTCISQLPLTELVLLHTRTVHWQEPVRNFIVASAFKTKFRQEFTLKAVGELVLASSSFEWQKVIEILFQAASAHFGDPLGDFLDVVRHVPMLKVPTKPVALNESPKQRPKDLVAPGLHFLQFGRYLVETLMQDERFGFISFADEQWKLVKVFVTIAVSFPDEQQYAAARQLTLLSLHDLIQWTVDVNKDVRMRKKLRIACLMLSKVPMGKQVPIVQKISSLVKV